MSYHLTAPASLDESKTEEPERAKAYFPGWTMLGFSAAAQFMSGPGQSYSVSAFKDPMRIALGVSETDYSLAYGVATLISGASLPLSGWLVDRFGARRMLPAISALLVVGCIVMSRTDNLPSLYVGFTMIRCFGQGALTLVAAWLVGEWFFRRRGLATSVSGLGSSISVMTIPIVNGWLVRTYGWETAWLVLAAMVGATMIVPALLFVRDRPEDLGLCPDGTDPSRHTAAASSRKAHVTRESWMLREVLRDRTFWKLLAVPTTSGMICTGIVFHQVALFGSRGASAGFALGLISLQAAVATVAALGAGWWTDRASSQRLLALAMLLLSVSSLVLLWMPHPALGILFAVLTGLHGSLLRSAGAVVWVNYYGRGNQGAIRGVSMAVMILGAAVGPLPLAMSLDRLSTYDPVLAAFAVIPLVAGAVVWFAKTPSGRSQTRFGES